MPLQKYTYKNVTYFVDYRLQQFRSAVDFPEIIAFIDFKSDEGDEIIVSMMNDEVFDFNKYNL